MTSGSQAFLAWLGQAMVVVIGWFVVNRQSAKRDRDKARREIVAESVDKLSETLNQILVESRVYHLNPRDEALELRIKMVLQDISLQIVGLSDVCEDMPLLAGCRSDVAVLRRAVTGRHFEDEHIGPILKNDAILESIGEAGMRSKRALMKLKHGQFKLSSSSF